MTVVEISDDYWRRGETVVFLVPKDEEEPTGRTWVPTRNPVEVARLFHEAYERLAPQFGYATREASAVPWDKVPGSNKRLMIATAEEVLKALKED